MDKTSGRTHYLFPPAIGNRPVEPHPDLLVKTMVIAGVPLSRSFKTRAGPTVTIRQLLDDVMARFRYRPAAAEFWQSASWTIDVLGAREQPGGDNEGGCRDAGRDGALREAGEPRGDQAEPGVPE